MRLFRRSALVLSTALLILSAIGFEPAIHRDLSATEGSLRLSVGAVRVPLWSVAFAQGAREVSLDDVAITTALGTYTIKRIEFSGLTSTEADVRALFDPSSTEPLGTRLEKISAKRVSIPEVVFETRLADLKDRTVFRNVVANDVERGRIRLATAAESTEEATGPKGKATMVMEHMTAADTDLAALARIYAQKAGPQPEPLTKVQGSYTVESATWMDDKGTTMKVGRTTVRDLSMRPTEESWFGLVTLITAMSELDKPSDEDAHRALTAVLDAVDAVQLGSLEIAGVDMTLRADKDTLFATVKRIAFTGATASQPSDARIEGIEFRFPQGTAKVDLVSYAGFSFEPTLRGLRALRGKPLDQMDSMDSATLRSLIPIIGTVRYAGLSFDFEAPDKDGRVERFKASVGETELSADKPLNGIPTNLRAAVRNLAFPLPPDRKDDTLKPLLDLGYKALDVSYAIALNWNEAGEEVLIRDVSVSGVDMGQVSLKAVVGGVRRDVFSTDSTVAMAAAFGARAQNAEIVVENRGLLDRYLEQEARKQKKTADAVRREYVAAAAVAVPAMLGNSEQAKTIGQAVSRFIARPTRLKITARARDRAGLGVSDLVGSSNPAALLEKLDVTATVDERL